MTRIYNLKSNWKQTLIKNKARSKIRGKLSRHLAALKLDYQIRFLKVSCCSKDSKTLTNSKLAQFKVVLKRLPQRLAWLRQIAVKRSLQSAPGKVVPSGMKKKID
jgi:hypothetical protein